MATAPTRPSRLPRSLHLDEDSIRASVVRAFDAHFFDAQYVWISTLSDHLSQCRRQMGDLDTVLILAIIGQATLGKISRAKDLNAFPEAPVNANSIATVTGIPRETARRKLAAMQKRGWIEPTQAGGWQIARLADGNSRAREELADITRSQVARLANLVAGLLMIGAQEDDAGT